MERAAPGGGQNSSRGPRPRRKPGWGRTSRPNRSAGRPSRACRPMAPAPRSPFRLGAWVMSSPFRSSTETWYSPDLQTVVLAKRTDPRTGETVTRLANISRSEPARALFEVPADFKVSESPPPDARRRRTVSARRAYPAAAGRTVWLAKCVNLFSIVRSVSAVGHPIFSPGRPNSWVKERALSVTVSLRVNAKLCRFPESCLRKFNDAGARPGSAGSWRTSSPARPANHSASGRLCRRCGGHPGRSSRQTGRERIRTGADRFEIRVAPYGPNVLAYARVKPYRPATAVVRSYEPGRRSRSTGNHRISIYTENLPTLLADVAELIGVRASRRYRPLANGGLTYQCFLGFLGCPACAILCAPPPETRPHRRQTDSGSGGRTSAGSRKRMPRTRTSRTSLTSSDGPRTSRTIPSQGTSEPETGRGYECPPPIPRL